LKKTKSSENRALKSLANKDRGRILGTENTRGREKVKKDHKVNKSRKKKIRTVKKGIKTSQKTKEKKKKQERKGKAQKPAEQKTFGRFTERATNGLKSAKMGEEAQHT